MKTELSNPILTCLSILANGRSCTQPAAKGSNYCSFHKSQRIGTARKAAPKKKAAAKKPAAKKAMAKKPAAKKVALKKPAAKKKAARSR